MKYLQNKRDWTKLFDFILKNEQTIGWDTEFTGVDFDNGDNCVGRSKLDVWSVAIPNGVLHPRGYENATGYILPRESLDHSLVIEFFKSPILKPAHNAIVDIHTIENCGLVVENVLDTLHLSRFLLPGRFKYGIDVLGKELLGVGKFISYKELCEEPNIVVEQQKVKRCICGEEGCRKRKGHDKFFVIEDVDVQRGYRTVPISDIRPGDSKWQLKVDYAGQDAVLAFCLADFLIKKAKKLNYENPFRFIK